MNPHFFTALFTLLSFGSGLRWRLRRLFRGWYPRIAAFPSRGRCPEGTDGALAVWKRMMKAEKGAAHVEKA